MNVGYVAKAITSAIGAGLTAALSYYPHANWIPIAAAVCTMLATYAIPNVPKQVPTGTSSLSGNLPDYDIGQNFQAPIQDGADTLPIRSTEMNFTERVQA